MRTDKVMMKNGVGYAYRRRRSSPGGKDMIFVLTESAVFFGSIYGSQTDAYAVAACAIEGELPPEATELLNLGIAATYELGWDFSDNDVRLNERDKGELLIEQHMVNGVAPKIKRVYSQLDQEERDKLFGQFVKKRCVACGGNWCAMLESALKADFPEFWAEIESSLPDYGHGGVPRFAALAENIHKCIAVEFDKDNNYLN